MSKDVLELIKQHFPANWGTLVLFLLALITIFYIFHKFQFFKMYEYFSDKREKNYLPAKDLLTMEKLSKSTQLLLIESLEKFAFNKYYGINIEKKEREILIKFQKENEQNLTWEEIKKAIRYIKIKNNKIIVNFNKLDFVFYGATYVLSVLFFVLGTLLLIVLLVHIFHNNKDYLQLIQLLISSIIMLFISIFIATNQATEKAAMKIKKIVSYIN